MGPWRGFWEKDQDQPKAGAKKPPRAAWTGAKNGAMAAQPLEGGGPNSPAGDFGRKKSPARGFLN